MCIKMDYYSLNEIILSILIPIITSLLKVPSLLHNALSLLSDAVLSIVCILPGLSGERSVSVTRPRVGMRGREKSASASVKRREQPCAGVTVKGSPWTIRKINSCITLFGYHLPPNFISLLYHY